MANIFLTCKECILENPTSFYGCFYLGPFNSSQSLTVANGLRRTLLSEIPSLGIQSVSIEGIEHEFCTSPGIRESILDFLLNFKQISLKYTNQKKGNFKDSSNRKIFYGYLNVRGPGIIRASDLKLPPSIISVDPNQYIATLTTDGVVNLRFTIIEGISKMEDLKTKDDQKSKNFAGKEFPWFINQKIFKEENKDFHENSKNSERWPKKFKNSKILWLDPIFSPVLRVNYIIESCAPLEFDPLNQVIVLEIWTNGSLHPRDALYFALNKLSFIFFKLEQMKILNNVFSKSILKSDKFYSKTLKKMNSNYNPIKKSNFIELKKNFIEKSSKLQNLNQKPISKKFELKSGKNLNFYNFGIEILNLPFRIKNSFLKEGIFLMKDLLNLKAEDLKKIRGIGNQEFNILLKKLNEIDLKLKF